MADIILMRQPCNRCGCEHGTITRKSNNDVVRCKQCNYYVYNKPRTEDADVIGKTREPKTLF